MNDALDFEVGDLVEIAGEDCCVSVFGRGVVEAVVYDEDEPDHLDHVVVGGFRFEGHSLADWIRRLPEQEAV